jgi:hypothetical protein
MFTYKFGRLTPLQRFAWGVMLAVLLIVGALGFFRINPTGDPVITVGYVLMLGIIAFLMREFVRSSSDAQIKRMNLRRMFWGSDRRP